MVSTSFLDTMTYSGIDSIIPDITIENIDNDSCRITGNYQSFYVSKYKDNVVMSMENNYKIDSLFIRLYIKKQ